ncbi:MAG TPA: ABC transporter ATP-binding protein [Pseudonocardia sp.]|nr:ABC transporter ATP-binding protein [Pseudonocardia sp.]
MTVLHCAGLSRSFGALKAVQEVDLEVGAGSRHALIGPNGAGKSTLFKLITGTLRADAGSVTLEGRTVTELSEVRRSRIGMSQTMQHASLFTSMTARETVALGIQRHDGSRVVAFPRPRGALRAKADELLVAVGLGERAEVPVPSLSHGERKQLEVALALACRPRLLLLDEPAAGMSPAERARLVQLLRTLPTRITLLFVEHDLDLVFALADRVSVLHLGRMLLTGTPDEVRTSEDVRAAYLGSARREELFLT